MTYLIKAATYRAIFPLLVISGGVVFLLAGLLVLATAFYSILREMRFRGAPVVSQPSPMLAGKLPFPTTGEIIPLLNPGSYGGPDGKNPL